MNRRLYRSRHDQRVAGVAGGVAEYLNLDPSLVRILWILSIFLGGAGLILYIVMAIIVPVAPEDAMEPAAGRQVTRGDGRGMTYVGIALILFGALALVNAFLPNWADGGHFLWPAFILGLGVLLVAGAMRREPSEPTEPAES